MDRVITKLLGVGLAASLFIVVGCVKDDQSDCPPPVPPNDFVADLMLVKIVDAATGEEEDTGDRLTSGHLYIFDAAQQLIGHVSMPDEELGKPKQIPLSRSLAGPGDEIYISAWGNLVDTFEPFYIEMGDDMSAQHINLEQDPAPGDNWLTPGDIFFGMHSLVLGQPDDGSEPVPGEPIVHVITITQPTAKLTITTRGLPEGAHPDDYYYNVGRLNAGYTYQGDPVQGIEGYSTSPTDHFQNGDLVMQEPLNLIPSIDPDNVDENSAVLIQLYQSATAATRADENDIDLTDGGVTNVNDGAGDYITLRSGQTTNVLIDFDHETIEVSVKMTPWGEVYQWSKWE